MLDKQEEKKIIYELMKELMVERRALSQQYYELKQYLDSLSQLPVEPSKKEFNRNNTLLEKEKIRNKDEFYKKNKSSNHIPFDRVSKNILSILKRLNTEYELHVTYSNLTNNILPKMLNEYSLPIERAYRGYWQYRLKNS
ncbi:hypothetical protein [Enterococcus faecalis]|uniref:hypothetical protein n=1 Tax=Enterococcus faecalis TaxID=1351 RepID=UPI003CC6629E